MYQLYTLAIHPIKLNALILDSHNWNFFYTSSIVAALLKLLATKNLSIDNCIAIGTDNASVMAGINNGVYCKLKQENSSSILMSCVCNSIQHAMSYASAECLPRNLEYLIAENHNWLTKLTVRQYQYE